LELNKKNLSNQLIEYLNVIKNFEKINNDQKNELNSFENLKIRHNAALDLIGEKEEKIFEMQQEFEEVKNIFRNQINELLNNNKLDK
jgi:hypothetical protein